MCVWACMCNVCNDQKRVSDSLGLNLEVGVSLLMRMLGTEPRPSIWALSSLVYWAVILAPCFFLFIVFLSRLWIWKIWFDWWFLWLTGFVRITFLGSLLWVTQRDTCSTHYLIYFWLWLWRGPSIISIVYMKIKGPQPALTLPLNWTLTRTLSIHCFWIRTNSNHTEELRLQCHTAWAGILS